MPQAANGDLDWHPILAKGYSVKLTAALLITLVASFSIFAEEPKQPTPFPEAVPTMFKFNYEHDMGSSYGVDYQKGLLIVEEAGMSRNRGKSGVKPTREQWMKFFHELNEAKVYKWASHYSGSSFARDGDFRWSIDIQVGDQSFHSAGSTALPLDGDLNEAQRGNSKNVAFDLYLAAVSHLIGRDHL